MTQTKPLLNLFLMVALLCAFALPLRAHAQNAPVLIRDTEIEATFKEWLNPLLKAAGMGPESVNLILVQSPEVNAFVAGGANIFIYTGLIEKSEEPGEVIGVLAHELGHIAGGHLISTQQALENASYESILGAVLGVGAAVLTGNGGAATAIISGSGSMAQRRFLSHSRVNESSADQAALRFMQSAHLNPNGLESFLEKLDSDELLPVDQQSEYVRTHPLNRNRIEAMQTGISKSPYKDKAMPEHWHAQHARMKAKLTGFISPGRVPWVYNDSDKSIPARYARAIAAYRQNKIAEALQAIDGLIETEPQNPYFIELKAQMLRDFGRVDESLPYYRKAADMLPRAGLVQIDLGHALLESRKSANHLDEAIDVLQGALHYEPRSSRAHRLLATAYGRQGQEDMAKLHLAEEALLQRRVPYAKQLAQTAIKSFEDGGREWIKARDILADIETIERNPNYQPRE